MMDCFQMKAGLALAGCVFAVGVQAAEVTYSEPTDDRWVYPFNTSNGFRGLAPTFGAAGEVGSFDDADGQLYLGFDTTGDFAAGLGASSYQVNRVSVTVTTRFGGFSYDPTYDGFGTYDGSVADADAGRPVHLMGAGFRGGFNSGTFSEFAPFSFGAPTDEGVRNVFAADVSGGGAVDASNFVRDAFEISPLATGQVAGLSAGDAVGENTTYTFEVDLTDPEVLSYFQSALNDGVVPLTLISLHSASQTGGEPTPQWITKENFEPGVLPATLTIDVVVPEPSSLALLGLGGLALLRRRK